MTSRYKNANWVVPDEPSLDYAKLSVLMDIRDELQVLNRVFQCPNFLAVPRKLDIIIKNTKKKKRLVKSRIGKLPSKELED